MKKTFNLLLIVGIAISMSFCSNSQTPATQDTTETIQASLTTQQTPDTTKQKAKQSAPAEIPATEQTNEDGSAQPVQKPAADPAVKTTAPAKDKRTKVIIHTSFGDITAELYNETPKHRDNFIKNIKEGWYNGSPWHRVIKNFMIQGGQNADGRQDPGYTVPAEFLPGLFHKKGALAAARMPDQVNPQKASSGSQFYIVQGQVVPVEQLNMFAQRYNLNLTPEQIKAYTTVGGTPHLDGTYTVFGEVIDGLSIVDKIAAVKTGPGDKPVENTTMTIEIIEE